MSDPYEAARAKRNILERLGAKIPGIRTYIEREMRREVDKLERDWMASRLDAARSSLQSKVRDWSRHGNLAGLDIASSLDKALDRLANRVRHADYGVSGVFDVVKIREDELLKLYEFDLELAEKLESLEQKVAQLPATGSPDALTDLLNSVKELDSLFDKRGRMLEEGVLK